ncbi:hypothetical protein [Schaedlerella sp.]|uniref:hypothetical protein n=1 Tax=Schaedlerella sp. TaxID=2676057 RepID=UPI003749C20C
MSPAGPVQAYPETRLPLYGSAEELARVAGIYEEEMGSEEEEAPAYGNITPLRPEDASEYEDPEPEEQPAFAYEGAAQNGRSVSSYGTAAQNGQSASVYGTAAQKSQPASANGGAASKGGSPSPAYGAAAGKGVNVSGASGTSQMKRIPGRFQDVVQRMIEDTTEYEEVLEGPPLPEEAARPAGHPDMIRANGGLSRQSAEYSELDASYGDGEDLRDYDRSRHKNRKKGDAARQVIRRTMKGNPELSDREESTLKEEAIRQILEEFLA